MNNSIKQKVVYLLASCRPFHQTSIFTFNHEPSTQYNQDTESVTKKNQMKLARQMLVYTKGEKSNGETFILLDVSINIHWLYLSSVSVHPPGN